MVLMRKRTGLRIWHTYAVWALSLLFQCLGLLFGRQDDFFFHGSKQINLVFIKPARKTLRFSDRDISAVPYSGLGKRGK